MAKATYYKPFQIKRKDLGAVKQMSSAAFGVTHAKLH